jgi:hypothetical protein
MKHKSTIEVFLPKEIEQQFKSLQSMLNRMPLIDNETHNAYRCGFETALICAAQSFGITLSDIQGSTKQSEN